MARYEVTSVTGHTVSPGEPGGRKPMVSFSVVDTLQAHQEVGRFYHSGSGHRTTALQRKAEELCDELNREDETMYGRYPA